MKANLEEELMEWKIHRKVSFFWQIFDLNLFIVFHSLSAATAAACPLCVSLFATQQCRLNSLFAIHNHCNNSQRVS